MRFLLNSFIFLPLVSSSALPKEHQYPRQYTTVSNSASDADLNANPILSPQDKAKKEQNINPDWSPDPENIAPISLDYPISPWNDNGRSQVPENGRPPWNVCPETYLNCEKCPRDFRCLSTSTPSPSIDKASTSVSTSTSRTRESFSTVSLTTSRPASPGVFDGMMHPDLQAVTTSAPSNHSQPYISSLENPTCPLRLCNANVPCGAAAWCKRGYCVCPNGRKGAGTAFRGWSWPEALVVYVDPGVSCSLSCESIFCSEVQRARGCMALAALGPKPGFAVPARASSTAVPPSA
ncbi:hypothetical protein CC80DRAFT_548431 [Byssothecium circinans]|uniref:Uncharacterized protein n=1 Tax=Byssothecium circinans TaxID=147558 RepID=A0A6A5TTZ2_9PLEO|nr:hypothetical protein CC80DRAFT_548431 [Byssothecium circinans]